MFIETLETLVAGTAETENLDFIGITLKQPEAVAHLRKLLTTLTSGRFDIFTASARDSSLVALLAIQKGLPARLESC